LPHKRSGIFCPRCKEIGGFLQRRWVKRTVNIPKAEKITSIPEAWNYAAKVCLRTRELMILFPPYSEEVIARQVYNNFDFGQHTVEETKAFELTHLSTPAKNIKKKKIELTRNVPRTTERKDDEPDNYLKRPPWDTIHTRLPKDSGRISKSSVSYVYAAIVCLIFRDISYILPPDPINREYAKAIYTYFSLFERDLRHQETWQSLFQIFSDVEEHGYHGAASLNAGPALLCKNCSNSQKNKFVQMEQRLQENNSVKYICYKCGCEEPINRSLTSKHLRNIHERVRRKLQEVYFYSPIYIQEIKNRYKYLVTNDKEDFLKRFHEYEDLASKDLLSAQYRYFIGHYDSTKRTNRKWCPITNRQLAEVKINDNRYVLQYLPLVHEAVNACIYGATDELTSLFKSAYDKLGEIGWPERYIRDKIDADYQKCIDSVISIATKEKS